MRGDLTSVEVMEAGMKGCDAVCHMAARVGMWGDLEDFLKENVEGTKNVLKAAKKAGVSKFVHCSTEATCVRDSSPLVSINEEYVLKPPKW